MCCMVSITTSIRLDKETLDQLDHLGQAIDRPRSWIVARAVEQYLDHEEWFVRMVEEGIAAADRGELVPHDDAMAAARDRVRQDGR